MFGVYYQLCKFSKWNLKVAQMAIQKRVIVMKKNTNMQPSSGWPWSGQSRSGQPRSGQPRSGQPRSGQPRLGQPRLGQNAECRYV